MCTCVDDVTLTCVKSLRHGVIVLNAQPVDNPERSRQSRPWLRRVPRAALQRRTGLLQRHTSPLPSPSYTTHAAPSTDALRLNPACPASLRFVIGLTNARLGRDHAAQVCFARTLQASETHRAHDIAVRGLHTSNACLQLDKTFVQAIAGSAILAFNRGNLEEHVGLLRNVASSGASKVEDAVWN